MGDEGDEVMKVLASVALNSNAPKLHAAKAIHVLLLSLLGVLEFGR